VRYSVLLLFVALMLGAAAYVSEIRGTRERAMAELSAGRLFEFETLTVRAIEVRASEGEAARLVSKLRGWQLEKPLVYPADPIVIRDLLSDLRVLVWLTTIDDPPTDRSAFGLSADSPYVRIFVGRDDPVELRLGASTPVGDARYASVSDQPDVLFTVSQSRVSSLLPDRFALRAKDMLRFDPAAVKSVAILQQGVQVVKLERAADDWMLTEPLQDRADKARIERVLQDLVVARATGFVDEPAPLAEYGLASPELELLLELPEGTQRVQLGRVQDKAYVRVDEAQPLFQTSDRLPMMLPRTVFSFRYKQVIALEGEQIARLQLVFPRDDSELGFVKKDGKWNAEGSAFELRPFKLEDLSLALENVEAVALEAKDVDPKALGLDPARVRVTAFDSDGNELGWLELGDPGSDAQGLSARASTGPTIWRVDVQIGDDIPLGAEAFDLNFLDEAGAQSAP